MTVNYIVFAYSLVGPTFSLDFSRYASEIASMGESDLPGGHAAMQVWDECYVDFASLEFSSMTHM